MNIKENKISARKKEKKEKQTQKSRLIIRNLSFKASENDIRKTFSQFGSIVDINLPKKENGQQRGFAFVSFDNIGSSLKAIKHVNGKKILNRSVAVDFSLPKNAYDQLQSKNDQSSDKNCFHGARPHINDDKINSKSEEKIENSDEDNDDDSNDEEIDEDDQGEEEEDGDDEDDENIATEKKSRKPSDVLQEKTVFIRNLDLDTTEKSLAELLSTYGLLEYCKICIDHFTEKSKGSAFAKFKKKEDAHKLLEESSAGDNPKLYIDGQQINVTLALPRNKLVEIENAKRDKHKDKRNLYLSKEGLIYPNSPAAVGVSQTDLKKRVQLEERKRKMLQNFHNFISDRRLCIHNLPPKFSDKKLKQLFLNALNDKSAKILWAKVMCNKNTDNKLGNSKGFGFVEFNAHIHALKALRILNNNPDIFTSEKRPIVEFSIENMVALNMKKFRQLKQQKLKESTDDSGSVNLSKTNSLDKEQSYSGVMTKPLTNEEKVIQPKVNRKIGEVKNQLKKRNKELKAKKKKNENKGRHQKKLERKEKNKPKDFTEDDVFDSHYKKRKMAFVSAQSTGKSASVPIKKAKWFVK